MKFRGYLNVEVLDEQIANARKMSKAKKSRDSRTALQWAKTTRELVELRNMTLDRIKLHLLGHHVTGAGNEPSDVWDSNDQVEFGRYFKNLLSPWTLQDLRLACEACGTSAEDVSDHYIEADEEHLDLCEKCYEKRCEDSESDGEDDGAKEVAAASRDDIKTLRQSATLAIRMLKDLPLDRRIAKLEEMLAQKVEVAPGIEPAYEAYRTALQKELDDAKTVLSANPQET